jgi:hypothetical protein
LPNKIVLERLKFKKPGGRLLLTPAGFYSNGWGPLPWRWGNRAFSRIEVVRIE